MPVLSKKSHERLVKALNDRFNALKDAIESRELRSNKEGAKNRYSWANPEQMCATVSSASEIRIAVSDFSTILAELKKLK